MFKTNEAGRIVYLTPEESKIAPMPHHRAGLTWTATGYGERIPSPRMVRIGKRWHRVYVRIFSNIGTAYIVSKGERIAIAHD